MKQILYLGSLSLFMLLCPFTSNAQNSIEISPLSAFSVFAPDFNLTGKGYGLEVSYNLYQRHREEEWIKKINVRHISIVAGYRNLNQVALKDSLGSEGFLRSAYSISAKINAGLLKINRTELLLKAGFGFTYSPSSYFEDGNPIVGSKINFSPQAGLKLITPLKGAVSLAAGLDVFHYSNVGFRIPNNGVNSIEFSLGIINEFKNAPQRQKLKESSGLKGFVEIGADIGKRGVVKEKASLLKSGFYAGYNHRINSILSVTGGANAVYYYTPYNGMANTFQYFASSYDRWRYGAALGGDIWLGKLILMGNYGYYLKFNGYYPMKNYWTYGLKYYANSYLGFQAKIYAHKSQAEFVGWGVMFRIPTQTY